MSKHFAVRTVRHGRIKIDGVYYRPQQNYLAYDGRLDGLRFLFGRYLHSFRGYETKVSLCCTAQEVGQGEADEAAPYVVDGTLPWLFWYREE